MLKLIKKFIIFNLKIIYAAFFMFFFFILISVSSLKNDTNRIIQNYNFITFSLSDIHDDKLLDSGFLYNKTHTFYEIIKTFKSIRFNENVEAIIIDIDNTDISPSKVEELTKEFEILKLAGKKIYAYASNINNSNYVLASIADEIVMPETLNARVELTGYYKNNLFYKNILDKFGVKFEVIHIGSHKSFGEEYYQNKLSKESKQDKQRILDNRLNSFINTISKNLDFNKEIFEKELLNGTLASVDAFYASDLGLISYTMNYHTFLEYIGSTTENTVNILDIISPNYNKIGNEIAIITLEGEIINNNNNIDLYISEENFLEKLNRIYENKNVKALILRINSPGGDAFQAEMIHSHILEFKGKTGIPVYASISDVAASGGYYIASSADKIFSNEASITGSIGVVSIIPKFVGSLDKFNINNETLQKGKYSGIYSPFYNLNEEDKKLIQSNLEDIYLEFKSRVADSRNLSDEKVESIAQGKLWLGNEAVNNGLVDGILSLNEVIDKITSDLKITEYNVVEYNSRFDYNSFIDNIKNYIFADRNIKITDKLEKQLQILNTLNTKPLYYNYDINELEY